MSNTKDKAACIPPTSTSRSWKEISIEPFRLDLTSPKFRFDLKSQISHRMRTRIDENRLNTEGSVWERLHAASEIFDDSIAQKIMRLSTGTHTSQSQVGIGTEGDWSSTLSEIEGGFVRSSNELSDRDSSHLWQDVLGVKLLDNDNDNATNDIESIIISKNYNKAQELWSQFKIIGLKKKDDPFSLSLAKGITTFDWSIESDLMDYMRVKNETDRTILKLENDIKGLKGLGPSYLRPTEGVDGQTIDDVLAERELCIKWHDTVGMSLFSKIL